MTSAPVQGTWVADDARLQVLIWEDPGQLLTPVLRGRLQVGPG